MASKKADISVYIYTYLQSNTYIDSSDNIEGGNLTFFAGGGPLVLLLTVITFFITP